MNALTNSSISNGFDTVFSDVDSTKKLNLNNYICLRLFYLDIFNNEFTYTGLHQLLQRNIGRYVFSRASIEQFKADGDAEADDRAGKGSPLRGGAGVLLCGGCGKGTGNP